jgi:hypothetical protein
MRNDKIPGLEEATTWMYDTDQVDAVNKDFCLFDGLHFQGAQLVDSLGLCLTRPLTPFQKPGRRGGSDSDSDDDEDKFIIYLDKCTDYLGNIDNHDNVDAIKRQTWIIEKAAFTEEEVIIRATCEDKAIKRLINRETIDHSCDTICD